MTGKKLAVILPPEHDALVSQLDTPADLKERTQVPFAS
jgi:hypothetical protein